MQRHRFPAPHVDDGGARIAAECGAIVGRPLVGAGHPHLSRRDPLDVVAAGENPLHQLLLGDRFRRRPRRIADDHDILAGRGIGRGERHRHPICARGGLQLQQRDVSLERIPLDPDHAFHLERRLAGIVDLMLEVDRNAEPGSVLPGPKHETPAVPGSHQFGHVAVGHDDILGHQPAGSDPVDGEHAVGDVDPANRWNEPGEFVLVLT